MPDGPFATIQVRTTLALSELCALYWDGLLNRFDGNAEWATRVVDWTYGEFTNRVPVRNIVSERLLAYGERAIDGGRPNTEYPSDDFADKVKAIVARAYKLV